MSKLRIASWNCNAKFGEVERNAIFKKEADIYVIQEYEKKLKEQSGYGVPYKGWYGDDKESQRGIGIFSSNYEFEPLFNVNDIKYRFVLPFKVTGKNQEFILFAIWTKKYIKDNRRDYIEHVYDAITDERYKKHLKEPTILIGDFNSNKNWDKDYKKKNHTEVEKELKLYGISDVCRDEAKIAAPTLYWRYHQATPFRVDYCFASEKFKVEEVKIGEYENWVAKKLSDHCPLIVTFDL